MMRLIYYIMCKYTVEMVMLFHSIKMFGLILKFHVGCVHTGPLQNLDQFKPSFINELFIAQLSMFVNSCEFILVICQIACLSLFVVISFLMRKPALARCNQQGFRSASASGGWHR